MRKRVDGTRISMGNKAVIGGKRGSNKRVVERGSDKLVNPESPQVDPNTGIAHMRKHWISARVYRPKPTEPKPVVVSAEEQADLESDRELYEELKAKFESKPFDSMTEAEQEKATDPKPEPGDEAILTGLPE